MVISAASFHIMTHLLPTRNAMTQLLKQLDSISWVVR